MPLPLLRLGSALWSLLLRLVASFGHHRRAMARVAIRHEGQEAVLAHRGAPLMWFHVASLGELEQAIPVMQAFRAAHPETPWLLTVYSPSAWHPLQSQGVSNVIDGWTDGDLLAVLPDDLPSTWRNWFSSVPLHALALAKYDLWPNLLDACQAHNLPVHAFAAAPSSKAPNPKPSTPTLWKLVTTISVQDEASAASFARIGLTDNVTVDGDPRVERVLSRPTSLDPAWQAWASNAAQVVVAGSTWTEEEQALRTLDWHSQRRLVLVPHDVSTAHLAALDRLWEGGAIRASQWLDLDAESRDRWSVVVVDGTGLLFDLYRIGTVAVVGGGHGTGLHNVLEPASAGLPIVTGPELGAFREAHALERVGALSSGDVADLTRGWLADEASCRQFGAAGLTWLEQQRGASARIVSRWG
jgi:3-deoxy-D-manno-octulosonic-acid transferase